MMLRLYYCKCSDRYQIYFECSLNPHLFHINSPFNPIQVILASILTMQTVPGLSLQNLEKEFSFILPPLAQKHIQPARWIRLTQCPSEVLPHATVYRQFIRCRQYTLRQFIHCRQFFPCRQFIPCRKFNIAFKSNIVLK